MFNVTPLPNVNPFVMNRDPVSVKLLLSVTPLKVAEPLAVSVGVASESINVPPLIVPLRPFKPPVLNIPALPRSNVPVLVRIPVRLTVVPVALV